MIPILWVLGIKFLREESLIKENKMIQEIINNQIEKIKLKNRRHKHVRNVGDHLLYMHWGLADKAMKMHTLEGKELNMHVKSMTLMSSRIADYKKYINLITFLQK